MNKYELLNELAEELMNENDDVVAATIKGGLLFTVEREKDSYSVNVYDHRGNNLFVFFTNELDKAIRKIASTTKIELKEFKKWF